MRRFNVTTICVKNLHYMANVSKKVIIIKNMIDNDYYFTINRGRQKGKTTILNLLTKELKEKYLIVSASFEGASFLFRDEETFARNIFDIFAEPFKKLEPLIAEKIKNYGKGLKTIGDIGRTITDWCTESKKEIVILIDEVDKASNYYIFMDFLGMLRKKYIAKQLGEDITFKSVILAGVTDIKRIKTHITSRKILTEEEINNISKTEYNSPWNVAKTFKIDLDFDIEEVESLLFDYLSEHVDTKINTRLIAYLLHKYTAGYPYLVSKICEIIVEELDSDFTENGIEKSVKILLNESNTLFDDLIKNIENNKDLYNTIYNILVNNSSVSYNVHAHSLGIMYSIFKNENGRLKVHNKIFEMILYNYMIAKKDLEEVGKRLGNFTSIGLYENDDGSLDIKNALMKYQEYMKSVFNKFDKDFIERQGRLLLLAFFKPILNGKGFYFVEGHTGFEQRQDLVMTFGNFKYIIELKIWRGNEHHQKGIKQLESYLDLENVKKGYLVIYNKNENKEYKSELIKLENKDIFAVWV